MIPARIKKRRNLTWEHPHKCHSGVDFRSICKLIAFWIHVGSTNWTSSSVHDNQSTKNPKQKGGENITTRETLTEFSRPFGYGWVPPIVVCVLRKACPKDSKWARSECPSVVVCTRRQRHICQSVFVSKVLGSDFFGSRVALMVNWNFINEKRKFRPVSFPVCDTGGEGGRRVCAKECEFVWHVNIEWKFSSAKCWVVFHLSEKKGLGKPLAKKNASIASHRFNRFVD